MKLIKEIVIIIFVSAFIGIAYNFQKDKPLSLVYKPKEFQKVADDELFRVRKNNNSSIKDSFNIPNIDENNEINENAIPENQIVTAETTNLASNAKPSHQIDDALKDVENKDNNIADTIEQDLKKIHDRTVTYEQMIKILANPEDFIIIDARNSEQFARDKIGNAINIFPYEEMDNIANKIMSLPYDKTLIIYCDGGECDSSHKLADLLVDFGYDDLFIFTGGWEEWIEKRGTAD